MAARIIKAREKIEEVKKILSQQHKDIQELIKGRKTRVFYSGSVNFRAGSLLDLENEPVTVSSTYTAAICASAHHCSRASGERCLSNVRILMLKNVSGVTRRIAKMRVKSRVSRKQMPL